MKIVPGGQMTVSGRNQPSLEGACGPTSALTIVLTARLQCAARAVDRSGDCRRAAREVGHQPVALDGDCNLDGNGIVAHPVAVDDVAGFIPPVGQGGDGRTCLLFARVQKVREGRQNRFRPVFCRKLADSPIRDANGGDLRVEVAKRDLRHADIFSNNMQNVGGKCAGSHDPDARQPQPLLKDGGRVRRKAARNGAADIEIVGTH